MSLRLIFSCDGTHLSGMRCRGALPVPTVDPVLAVVAATQAGWSITGTTLCPSCARRNSTDSQGDS